MNNQVVQPEDRASLLEHWKTIVDVQMHFNDMLMRTRSLAATVVIGVFGAAAALVGHYPTRLIFFHCMSVHVSVVVIAFGLSLLLCVFLLDYLYYYRLLLAAVERGEEFERALSEMFPGYMEASINLTLLLSKRVSRFRAKTVLLLFYGIPFVAGLTLLVYLLTCYRVNP